MNIDGDGAGSGASLGGMIASMALLASLLLASLLLGSLLPGTAPSAEDPPSASSEPTPTPLARRDLVVEKDGKLSIDYFMSCTSLANDARGAKLQILVHAQALAKEISRDRFVADATRSTVREVDALAASRGVGSPDAPPVCREVGAPQGDVDYELKLAVKPGAVDVEVVDVAARMLAKKVSARHGADECVNDTMGTLHCARSPGGTAVKSRLGQVVCARGQCVSSSRSDWQCSRAAGGWAEVTQSGSIECEYGCYSPTSTQCQRMR